MSGKAGTILFGQGSLSLGPIRIFASPCKENVTSFIQ